MGKHTTIPAGYRLTVHSWENDADNYNSETLEGLSIADVKFYTELCKSFLSKNSGIKNKFGNMYSPEDDETEEFFAYMKKIITKHKRTEYEKKNWQDSFMDLLRDLGLSGDEFYTRVFDSFKVEYIAEPIVIDDVTAKFA